MRNFTDKIIDNIWWLLLGMVIFVNFYPVINFSDFLIISLLVLIIYKLKGRDSNNYMLYPYYSWRDIDETAILAHKFGNKASKLYDKETKLWPKIRERLIKEGKKKIKFADLDEEYVSISKEHLKYQFVNKSYFDKYLFLIRANEDILNGKKSIEEVEKKYMDMDAPWRHVFEQDGVLSIFSSAEKRLEGIYEKRMNEVCTL